MTAWERVFWDSVNVHPIAQTVRGTTLQEALERCREKPYDTTLSVPLGTTLGKYISDIR